jgi:hypothetical protein
MIKAVRQKKFHVWAVSTVAEGIEILTGEPAGQADREGNYPAGSIYRAVQEKLQTYLQRSIKLKNKFAGDPD